MQKIYFTVTGLKYRMGDRFFEKGMPLILEKEPDNKHDTEAIKVKVAGLGHVGYVANSVHTTLGDTYSAGRLYDKIGDYAEAEVAYILEGSVIGAVNV